MLFGKERRGPSARWVAAFLSAICFAAAAVARPAVPVFSRDGAVTVRSTAEMSGYRAPILVFVDRTRESLQRTVRMKLGSANAPLEVVVGSQRDGDTRVVTSQVRGADGALRERIELPDPEAADLAQFTRAICVALLRAWVTESAGQQGRCAAKDVPAWVVGGLIRHMNRETRQPDTDRMLLLWSHACLPPAQELVGADSWAATREPAVAATLLAWLLERRASGSAFESLLRGLSSGDEWCSARVAAVVLGRDDALALDEALDGWLLAEGRQVIHPGVTTDGVARRFRSHLLFCPSDCDEALNAQRASLPLASAADRGDSRAVRRWALSKAKTVRLAAVGHDGTLLAVSDAYALFLEALARGEKKVELLRLLQEAESKRGELERKTARGEVLRGAAAK